MDKNDRTNEIIDDRYKISNLLGQGGMALVYRAHDLITDKDVAIKMIKKDMAAEKINLVRFEREARAAASLNHPNIVKVLNVGTFEGLPYMVNEFINGQSLKDIIDVRGKFSFLEACDIMYQLCGAVSYANEHGVIHRDIKPANIYLTKDGTIKLGDFGIAIFRNSNHVTQSQNLIGSFHYMAPEVASGSPATDRSDIYAMGITFFELITSRVPFDHPNPSTIALMHIKDKFPSVRRYNPKTPPSIEEIIYKACQKNPMDRYNSALEMRKAIDRILKNPSLMEKKQSFFYRLFHRSSMIDYQEQKDLKRKKKELRRAAKEVERDERR